MKRLTPARTLVARRIRERLTQGSASLEELIPLAEGIVPFEMAVREYRSHLERTRKSHAAEGKPVKRPREFSLDHEYHHGLKQMVVRILWDKQRFRKTEDGLWTLNN